VVFYNYNRKGIAAGGMAGPQRKDIKAGKETISGGTDIKIRKNFYV